MQDVFRVIQSKGSQAVVTIKPARYVRIADDFKVECPMCGKECRATIRNGQPVLYKNCITLDRGGHCASVLNREQYRAKYGEDDVYESNYPVIFVFKNVELEASLMQRFTLDVRLNHLNYVVPEGHGYYTLQEKKGRRSVLMHHTSTGAGLPVARRDSFRQMGMRIEELIAEMKAMRAANVISLRSRRKA